MFQGHLLLRRQYGVFGGRSSAVVVQSRTATIWNISLFRLLCGTWMGSEFFDVQNHVDVQKKRECAFY